MESCEERVKVNTSIAKGEKSKTKCQVPVNGMIVGGYFMTGVGMMGQRVCFSAVSDASM